MTHKFPLLDYKTRCRSAWTTGLELSARCNCELRALAR
jgi:hypothetical protein